MREMKTASVVSAMLHAAVLLWALVSFSTASLEATPPESLPVDLVSAEDFSKLTKGSKDAPKSDEKKPLVEKIKEEPKAPEDAKPKVVEKKQEVPQAAAEPPPAAAERTDLIGDKLKKEEQKAEAPPQPKPLPPKKPVPQQPKFDADKIAALLDKRDPQRQAATGDVLNNNPSLGVASGTSAMLSQSELDALRARLRDCWNPPAGANNDAKLYVVLRVFFKKDGSVAREPVPIEGSASASGPALAESAKRALLRCQPFTMLRPDHYDKWKDIEIKFDMQDMFGG